jgi:hypothetical protein
MVESDYVEALQTVIDAQRGLIDTGQWSAQYLSETVLTHPRQLSIHTIRHTIV